MEADGRASCPWSGTERRRGGWKPVDGVLAGLARGSPAWPEAGRWIGSGDRRGLLSHRASGRRGQAFTEGAQVVKHSVQRPLPALGPGAMQGGRLQLIRRFGEVAGRRAHDPGQHLALPVRKAVPSGFEPPSVRSTIPAPPGLVRGPLGHRARAEIFERRGLGRDKPIVKGLHRRRKTAKLGDELRKRGCWARGAGASGRHGCVPFHRDGASTSALGRARGGAQGHLGPPAEAGGLDLNDRPPRPSVMEHMRHQGLSPRAWRSNIGNGYKMRKGMAFPEP